MQYLLSKEELDNLIPKGESVAGRYKDLAVKYRELHEDYYYAVVKMYQLMAGGIQMGSISMFRTDPTTAFRDVNNEFADRLAALKVEEEEINKSIEVT